MNTSQFGKTVILHNLIIALAVAVSTSALANRAENRVQAVEGCVALTRDNPSVPGTPFCVAVQQDDGSFQLFYRQDYPPGPVVTLTSFVGVPASVVIPAAQVNITLIPSAVAFAAVPAPFPVAAGVLPPAALVSGAVLPAAAPVILDAQPVPVAAPRAICVLATACPPPTL